MSDFPPVVFERELNAAIERVFDAWTKPETLKQWFRASESTVVEEAQVDLQVGGCYRIAIAGGEDRFVVFGQYLTIDRPNLLEFTWKWEVSSTEPGDTLVRVELEPLGERTKLRLIHSRLSTEASVNAHGAGWNGVLDSLVRLLN